jgi:hypothetical protein
VVRPLRWALLICSVVAFTYGCGGGGGGVSSSGPTGNFVTDLRAISANAKKMDDAAAGAWGDLVCTTFDNGGTRSDALANISTSNDDSKSSGDIPLDDVNPSKVINLAIRDDCPEHQGS